ncbi:MAG: hypothetical protein ACKVRO_19645 [Micropepsaceae bacterium]
MKRVGRLLAALMGIALFCGAPAQASWLFGPDKDEAKARLPGRTLQELISVLGYPDSSVQVGNETVYVWRNVELLPTDVPVYDDPLLKNKQLGTVTTDERLLCTFKAVFLADGTFANYSVDGNNYACRKFYRQFLKLPEKPAASAAPPAATSPSVAPAPAPPPASAAFVRPGDGPNRLIVFDDYEVSAPATWTQTYLNDKNGIVSIHFDASKSRCLILGVPVSGGTADGVWNKMLATSGKTIAQDTYIDNGVPVRLALVHDPDPTLMKLSAYAKATFVILTTGGIENGNKLSRADGGFTYCNVRALPGRR